MAGTSHLMMIVPKKSLCIPLKSDFNTLTNATPLTPQLGDMVYFRGKETWRARLKKPVIVGIVYEIAYAGGRPTSVKVHAGSEMKDLDYSTLLVLAKKS